jgi:gliding motility-associated-like protein
MKKIIFCVLLLNAFYIEAQVSIQNTLTPAQLVQNVLIGQGVTPTNIKFNGSPASAAILREQAGQFSTNFNGSNLGLSAGVVLATGNCQFATTVPPTTPTTSWPSLQANGPDPDLALLSGETMFNAAILEFDFIATGPQLNFDFVFASQEYPEWINNVNDSFGFFLSGAGIAGPYLNNAKNIALVPNTTIPVAIDNVNNGFNNSGSNPQNAQYYFNNSAIGLNPNVSATPTVRYDGFTKVLKAEATLICGQQYHIKLAVGNAQDNLFDSAVFLKNFQIPPMVLLDNYHLAVNNNVCFGETITISSGLTVGSDIFVWTRNGVPIPGENGANLSVMDGGLYALNVSTTSGCQVATDDIQIGYLPEITITTPISSNECTVLPPPYVFNIDQTTAILATTSDPTDYVVTYYSTNAVDAFAGGAIGLIPDADLTAYAIASSSATIWVRVESLSTGCVVIKSFTLSASTNPSGTIAFPNGPYCNDVNTLQPITSSATPGGIYSATPAGLNLDPVTGEINPSLSLPGTYTVNYNLAAAGNCPAFSPPPATVKINLTPANPLFVVVQPTCTVSTGKITISSPLGANLEYSIDGGVTFQASPIFNNVPSGISYGVTVRDVITHCGSVINSGLMNPVLGVPTAPTASVTTQPICSAPTGTIEISIPLGANLQYSNNGGVSYQASPIFTGLSPNTTYSFTVKDMVTGCVSAPAPILVNAIPANPISPTASITQPICTTPTATILVSAPIGVDLEYSIDNGLTYQSGLSFSGLAPNAAYNIIVRNTITGCVSSPSPFAVSPIPANPNAPVVAITQPTCSINTGSFVISSPVGANFEYSIDNGSTYTGSVSFTGLTAGTAYNVTVRNTTTGCISIASVVNIIPALAIPAAPTTGTTLQPTCAAPNGTITISAPLAANLQYSINGGVTYQNSPVFSGLAPNTTFNIMVKNTTSGCVSTPTPVVVAPIPAGPAAPTASTTVQPSCILTTGTIVISAPLGATMEYSRNGGTTYQASPIFAGLSANATYSFIVRDLVTGCVSLSSAVSVNAIPADPISPTAAITQPICTTPTATILVSAPLGVDLEYSIDNGLTYQSGLSFSGLAPNAAYNIIVRNTITGCVSSPSPFAVSPIPANPNAPVVAITQPTCSMNTGSFIISSPVGANLEYSIDNGVTFRSGVSFTGLTAGTAYNVTVRNTATGCISTVSVVNIIPAFAIPAAPTASTTLQPTCTAPNGTITLSAPLAANLQYSINGGATYQSSPVFSGLAPNTTFNITVKNTASGCVSTATPVVVAPIPAGPAAPTATTTVQPNCIITTGTIVISAPLGATLEYSRNGGATYQTSPIFPGLSANTTYSFTVRDLVTGCISLSSAVSVNAIPANPIGPIATITQPTCLVPTGNIVITAPIGSDLVYSIDGGITYQSNTTFANVGANATYAAMVKNNVTGCVSIIKPLVVNATVTIPATPAASGNNVCAGQSITLSTPTVAGAVYSWSGPDNFISSAQNPVILNAVPEMAGVYSVIISVVSGCPSLPGSVTIAVNPLPEPTLSDGSICIDSQTNTVLNPYVLDSGLGNTGYTFEWFTFTNGVPTLIPSANQSTYSANAAGVYGVQATNRATLCTSNIVAATVALTPTPNTVEAIASEYFADLQTITVNVSPPGDYQYQLDNGALQSSNVFVDVLSGEHHVYVKSACGEFERIVTILDYPRYFTPNNDGYNDTWNIFSLSTQAKAKIYIFDRFGKLLKEISPSGVGWDGKLNQQNLPATDYWFIVHYDENKINKVFKSHFALKR